MRKITRFFALDDHKETGADVVAHPPASPVAPRPFSRASLGLSCALVAFVSCTGAPSDGSESPGSVEERSSVCANPTVVLGVDVSTFQGSIDWHAAKGAGLEFAIARVSDGTYLDDHFDVNWSGIKGAGMIRGAYQFFEPAQDPGAQADIVIAAVGKLGVGDLPVVADVEATGSQSAATIVARLQIWFAKVEAGTGKRPFIYTGKYFWQDHVGDSSAFSSAPLWVAGYKTGSCVDIPDAGWSAWRFWQYTDKGRFAGISSGVDTDKFNGTLAELTAFAGGGGGSGEATYGARYVSQSFPLASTALKMIAGESLPAYIELKNVGTGRWNAHTQLATTLPRERPSAFTASDWVSPSRLSMVAGSVDPGGTYKFAFTIHAPSAPGTYKEHFGLVQDGASWFGDGANLGPADGLLEMQIDVTAAAWAGELVGQSFPRPSAGAVKLPVGGSYDGWIELKNTGTQSWKAGVTFLAPTPRDVPSRYAHSSWNSPTRISTPPADVAPGASYKFPVALRGAASGEGEQTFGLVEDHVAWFSDPAVGGGGPADDLLRAHIVVGDSTATGDAGTPVDAAGVPDGAMADADAHAHVGGSADGTVESGGGCSAGHPRASAHWMSVAAAAALLTRARRRRR